MQPACGPDHVYRRSAADAASSCAGVYSVADHKLYYSWFICSEHDNAIIRAVGGYIFCLTIAVTGRYLFLDATFKSKVVAH